MALPEQAGDNVERLSLGASHGLDQAVAEPRVISQERTPPIDRFAAGEQLVG
jgi:hypothetical protein